VHDFEAQRGVPREIVATIERTSDADVHGARVDEQTFLRRSSKRCAVGVGGAEVRVPCIQVRIEVDERDRSRVVIDRPQERKRDRVIASHADQTIHLLEQRGGRRLDLGDGLGDVERIARDVPRVGDLLHQKRLGVVGGMVGRAQVP